mgnify:CR=1 FL=1
MGQSGYFWGDAQSAKVEGEITLAAYMQVPGQKYHMSQRPTQYPGDLLFRGMHALPKGNRDHPAYMQLLERMQHIARWPAQ